jgi:hypothetical protein
MKHFGKLSASTALLALVPGLPAALLPGLPAPAHPRSRPAGPAGLAAVAVSPRHAGAAVGEYVNLSIGGVRDFSPTDAWAVGYACVSGCASVGGIGEIDHMVILHWNGTTWSSVPAPRQSASASYRLSAIAGDSATDAWAAGTKVASNGKASPLVLHWDGRAWSNASPATPATGELSGVSADTASDVWAVGQGAGDRTLILRWNGSTWSRVPSPDPGQSFDALTAGAAGSANNAWAAGFYNKTAASPSQALALHWNGTAWSAAALPGLGNGTTTLNAVTVLTARNGWAAGSSCPQAGCAPGTKVPALILSWNGTSWSKASTPDLPAGNELTGVAAISASDAWAVGAGASPGGTGTVTLIVRWNGRSWSTVTSPRGGVSSGFAAVSAASATDAWAAGTACLAQCNVVGAAKTEIPLLAHWNGHTWSSQ